MFHSLFLSIPFFCLSISSKFFLLPFLSFINMCYYLLMSIRKFLSQNPWTLSGPNTFNFGGLPNCCLNLVASIMISSCILLTYAFFDLTDPFDTFIMYYILGANIAPNFLLSSALGFTSWGPFFDDPIKAFILQILLSFEICFHCIM